VRKLLAPVTVATLASLALSLAAGCHRAPRERLTVAVSVFPLYDLVRRIAGPDADVVLVLPLPPPRPSSVPEWRPPPDAEARVAKARLLVSGGLGLDPWMDALLQKAAPKAKTLKLGDRVPTISSADGAIDGYVWLDPERARLMATAIAEELARADSPHAIAYGERASTVDRSLAALDKEIEARIGSLPTHDVAFPPSMAYYAERYGLRQPEPAKIAAGRDANALEDRLDLLGGGAASSRVEPPGATAERATAATYEDLIRFDTAALESSLRQAEPTLP
jgi:ABC-type Zn uptake system ZnuABC Zn-binding protein ZnuA